MFRFWLSGGNTQQAEAAVPAYGVWAFAETGDLDGEELFVVAAVSVCSARKLPLLPLPTRGPEPTAQEAAGPSSSRRSLLAGALAVAAPERANALTTEELRAANLFMTASPSVLSVSEGKKNAVGPTGTGFVWDASHVVTNFHVVKELKSPHVTFLRKVHRASSSVDTSDGL
ncbi:hypothetical protein AK812_SmicGene24375 [Symbiodinium microadriaticum]|uniref:Protease Do-like 1, chloroplastic n=1 Tax=Symbiodinium microadriaticum TaxID=2951 RepID=A0A1Q9DEY0_SYMMI|nr:hypothetical protein AK812_SmicGene24375 [Symbiodinium microadriaticum]